MIEKIDYGVITTLMIGVAIVGANSLAMGPIAPGIADYFSVSVVRVMLAAAGYGLGTAVSAFCLARYIDRIGAKASLQIAFCVLFTALCMSAVSVIIPMLIASQSIAGLAAGVSLPAIYALSAVAAPAGKENTVLGWVLVGWTLSLVGGVSVSALIADSFSWQYVYFLLAGICLVVLFLVSSIEYERPRVEGEDNSMRSVLQALLLPGVRPLLVVCFAYMAAFYGPYGYYGDHINRVLGLAVKSSGLVALSYGLGFGAAVFGDPFIDRMGARKLMPLSFVFIAGVYSLMGLFSENFFWLCLFSFFWGVANHFGLNVIISGLSAIDKTRRGTILGLYSCVTYLAASAGTLSYGWLYLRVEFAGIAYASMFLMLISALYIRVAISKMSN